ncbi:tetratricopeptide repeat protein [Orenia marismortui]|uniref:Uncharacterized protein n=1 Tax=Orenia marismortui TaxID=46469 RepID=A0A4R8H6P9_9FIRM|nr:tetratricopeptide repeat protein [Orenia marismortui]TDX53256.1 hypothetical protein C7959_103108 [Orenia marismortui]
MRRKIVILLLIYLLIFSTNSLAVSKFYDEWESIAQEKFILVQQGRSKLVTEYELAVAYANLGEIEEATKIFRNLKEEEVQIEVLQEMIPKYEAALEKESPPIIAANYLAFAYYISKDYEKSEEKFDLIIDLDPKNIWGYNYRAVVQHKLKEYDKAHQSLMKSLKLDDNEYTHFLLGANYYKTGNIFKALYHVGRGRKAADLFLDDDNS